MTTQSLPAKAVRGFLSLSVRQFLGSSIAAVGSIWLARHLGAGFLGMHAICIFLNMLLALFLDFAMYLYVVRTPREEIDSALIGTVFTLRVLLSLSLVAIVCFGIGPIMGWWYHSRDLYWLLALSFAAAAVASPFRLSLALLEKDMDYDRISAVELLGIAGFYLPAAALSSYGLGVWALIIGEICRGLSAMAAFALRPFPVRFRLDQKHVRPILEFGWNYVVAALAALANGGVNPLVVGKMAGFEAAGYIRIAEGIVTQATFLKVIGDRISYPLLAEMQRDKASILHAVSSWRLYHFILAASPLMLFTTISPWLVPRLYGSQWSPVVGILPLLYVSAGVTTIFALCSNALLIAGKISCLLRFNCTQAALMWITAPLLVGALGYVGYPLSLLAAAPAYLLMDYYFRREFGPVSHRSAIFLLLGSSLSTSVAWYCPELWQKILVIGFGHGALVALIPELRQALARTSWGEGRPTVET